MGKVKEIDPRNLGISNFLTRSGVRVDYMVGQRMVVVLQEGLKANNDGEVGFADFDRAIIVKPVNRGRWRLVSSLEEDMGRDDLVKLVYGVFTPDGNVLPDPYACASLTGRYQQVQEIFQQISKVLR